ncbi:hypothetical protein P3G55_00745 [Leptospira sp. 96542]|nr:hypothetical protein [Leptospira sp. 96542]
MPNGLNLTSWIQKKKNHLQHRMVFRTANENDFVVTYYRKETIGVGSFISCSFVVKQLPNNGFELYDMIFIVDYADYTKPKLRSKGGVLGPTSEEERTNILLPCVDEFLESQ